MRSIRLAWDNCFARRSRTGTGIYAARLLEHLSDKQDLSIQVLNGWPNGSVPQTTLRRAFYTAGNLAWTHGFLPSLLRNGHFDLLHSPAFIAPLASPCPTVVSVHDITYLLYPSFFAAWWVRYMKSTMPRVLKSASAIICGSQHSKSDIVKTYAVSGDKVHVIPYGVDHERFHPRAQLDCHWARANGVRAGYLLHVGELSYRKNIPTLLRAIAKLRSQGKWGERQLVLAGAEAPGMLGAAEIDATIHHLDLAAAVVRAGRVPDEHLAGLYAQAKLLVMPSLYEGFGFPVVEAMSAGTPVIASDTSSLPEVAGDAAILVPPADETSLAGAIANVVENAAIADELKRKGLVQAARFSWGRTADETLGVYRSVVTS
jgi:glycosyltransferase involved in cell wall biosynthesis